MLIGDVTTAPNTAALKDGGGSIGHSFSPYSSSISYHVRRWLVHLKASTIRRDFFLFYFSLFSLLWRLAAFR